MKKKLNVDSIANELEGASLFFAKPHAPGSLPEKTEAQDSEVAVIEEIVQAPAPPDSPTFQTQSEENQYQKRTNVRTDVRTDERTLSKQKRQKIRHAFDIYQDQLIALQMRQLDAVRRGKKKPKLGKMVQEAIELYLKQSNKRG